MAYDDKPMQRFDKAGADRQPHCNYNESIDKAKNAGKNNLSESNPMIEKEGFLGVDDIDRMRRRKIR
jgi:hypothetical protein